MAKPWAKAFYNSKAWRCCRNSYIDQRIIEDGGLCEVCHEELGFIVHHVLELTPSNINDPNVSLNHSNLRYVCKKCHDKEHGVFCEIKHEYFFDENGNIFPIPPLKNLWNGKMWDLKDTTTEKAANYALKKGIKQISDSPGGLFLNYRDNEVSIELIEQIISDRMKWYEKQELDIMIIIKNEVVKVLRYRKQKMRHPPT